MILSGEMTDEEKAEEYVNSKGFGSDYNNIDSNEEISQAYLVQEELLQKESK